MLLNITQAGYTLETNALQNGTPVPKIKEMVIDGGVSAGETVTTEAYVATTIAFERVSAGVLKIHGEIPPDVECWVKGIALRLEDGTIYAYGKYQEQSGGFFKGKGFAFSFFVLHSRSQNVELNFTYSPLDITAIAAQIADDAKTNIDAYIQDYFIQTTVLISGLSADMLRLTNAINSLKKGGLNA